MSLPNPNANLSTNPSPIAHNIHSHGVWHNPPSEWERDACDAFYALAARHPQRLGLQILVAALPMPQWLTDAKIGPQHMQALLDTTERCATLVQTLWGAPIPGLRASLRQHVLHMYTQQHPNEILHWAPLIERHDFPGMRETLVRCVGTHFKQTLHALDPTCTALGPSTVMRWRTQQLNLASATEVAAHNMQLLALEYPMTTALADAFCKTLNQTVRLTGADADALMGMLKRAQQQLEPVKFMVCRLLEYFDAMHATVAHNTHPAALLMEATTGFVCHPTNRERILALSGKNTPNGVRNYGDLFVKQYLAALTHRNAAHFVQHAFSASNPCFEAAAEHLLNYKATGMDYQKHPRPTWSSLANNDENARALVDWLAHKSLPEFIASTHGNLSTLNHAAIDATLGSRAFYDFMVQQQSRLLNEALKHLEHDKHDAVVHAFYEFFKDFA